MTPLNLAQVLEISQRNLSNHFFQFKALKGKEWDSKVKGGKQKVGSSPKSANQDVLIFIRLLEYNNKERALKMKRGKKVGLRISKTATAAVIRREMEGVLQQLVLCRTALPSRL